MGTPEQETASALGEIRDWMVDLVAALQGIERHLKSLVEDGLPSSGAWSEAAEALSAIADETGAHTTALNDLSGIIQRESMLRR